MDTREFKALELAARAKIEHRTNYWYVPSATAVGGHRVENDCSACSCDDFELRQQPCKHILAVRIVKDRNRGTPIPETPADPPKPRKTYAQDWPAYNAAQTGEKRAFLPLLADLCATVPEPPRTPGRGRKPVPVRDALFAAIFKVYSGFSGRRFMTDLEDAGAAGHVSKVPHYNFIFKVLEDEATGPILRDMVTRSSLPLRGVEINFAVDSSGFSSSKFERWFDTKYGVDRKRATWVKTHLCVGVETQVVAAAVISDQGDSPVLPELVKVAAANFPMRDVLADKAYLSMENVDFIADEGGTPFIPPKVNSDPNRDGAAWRKMFHLFAANRDEFLRRYHQRSNVESAFSMIKRKFGDAVRSKTTTAMGNEVLAKIVCHNVVCCIHAAHELGIDMGRGFGGVKRDEPDGSDAPWLIRFPRGRLS